MNNISAIIVAKHTPPFIKETLNSISDFVDEIIIADIGIDAPLLKELKAMPRVKIIVVEKDVPYVELIREDLKKKAKYEYILLLDPDEYITPELITLLKQNMERYDYFHIPRKNIIFGKWMKHSRWWPDYQVRFFKKDAVIWPKLIHHQPSTKGNGLTIRPDDHVAIVHHNYSSIDEYMNKALRYAKSEASELAKNEKEYTLKEALRKGLSEFVSRYFAAEGYKDGVHGFILAILQLFYCVLVFCYYWEHKKYHLQTNEDTEMIAREFFHDALVESNHWVLEKQLKTPSRIKIKMQNAVLKKFK